MSEFVVIKETTEEGIKEFDANKRRLAILSTDYEEMQEKVNNGLDLVLQQKLQDIHTLAEKLFKVEDTLIGETKALDLQLADTTKLKQRIEKDYDILMRRLKAAEADVGYDQ